MWKVVTSSNLNPPLKLFFYSLILTNNNLLLKIYCENIVITFFNYDFLFIILFPLFPTFISSILFFSSTRYPFLSLSPFFYLIPISLIFYLLPHSAQLSFFLFSLQCSLSVFFFFYLIPQGIMVKVSKEHFLFRLFLPIWEEKICGPGRENFLPGFPPFLFSLYSQTEENSVFYPIFHPS